MTEIIDRADVALILADPRFLVPEADAAAPTPFERFRADVSRFSNGAVHDARRRRLESMLAGIELAALARTAASLTRTALEAEPAPSVATVARHVPVTALGMQLGFRQAESLPPLAAEIADAYSSGRVTDAAAADTATMRLLDSAPGTDAPDDALLVQLLVQAYAATGAFVERAMQRLAASGPLPPATHDLLTATLRDDSPVPMTRRVAPDHSAGASGPDVQQGALLVLRLDGPDRDATDDRPPRTLAFGAGHRGCPAPHHALAIAVAIVEELRRAEARAGIHRTNEETIDVDAR
ncbi:hypothetical protein J7E29_16160 [Streptomyces sp. ISL-90]|nr:hypothetical protein [Streptomyces sp. ISL-90]